MAKGKNFDRNRQDFEDHFKKFHPGRSLERSKQGEYIDKDAYYEWAAYKKAFAQYALKTRNSNRPNSGVYLIGRHIPGVSAEPGKPETGKPQ